MDTSGSIKLEHHGDYVDSLIAWERRKYPDRRQTAAVLFVSPGEDELCLYLAQAAENDGRHNWNPPQGRIEKRETLRVAALRELYQEFTVLGVRSVTYVGSAVRELSGDHPKAKSYRSDHYHWVLAVANSYKLLAGDRIADAKWHHAELLLGWACLNMSPAKAAMFKAALARAIEGPLYGVPAWQNAARLLAI